MSTSSAAVVGDPHDEYWDARRHREGGDGRSERFESARQRTVILTFDTPEDAAAWDDAGQPLDVHQNSSVIAPNEAPRRLADPPTTSDRAALPPSSRPVVLSHEVPSPDDDCPPFGMLRPPLEIR